MNWFLEEMWKEANVLSYEIMELDGWICLIIVTRLARNEIVERW